MKNINLKIYTKNDFLNSNEHNISALRLCSINNNILGPKYFVKRFNIIKDEIINPDINDYIGCHAAFLCRQLSLIKYFINTFNLIKNDLMKFNYGGSNSLNYLFASYYNTNALHKICLYIFNKYNFTKMIY